MIALGKIINDSLDFIEYQVGERFDKYEIEQQLRWKNGIHDRFAMSKIISMADLMRLACLKATKARLFMSVGVKSLYDLGQKNPLEFRNHLQKIIYKTHIVKAIPTPKEVESDIGWAKLHPVIIDIWNN